MQLAKAFVLTASLVGSVISGPLQKKQASLSQTDVNFLQLAYYLESLEFTLYANACNSITDAEFAAAGMPPGFRANVCTIAEQEACHAEEICALMELNGVAPLPLCNFQFPYTTATQFVLLANMITSSVKSPASEQLQANLSFSVGIGAYIGALEQITDLGILSLISGSILAVEARHDAYLRVGLGASPFPTCFDTALTSLYAYNLAQTFTVSCPAQLPGVSRLPFMRLVNPLQSTRDVVVNGAAQFQPIPAGTLLQFAWDPRATAALLAGAQLYVAFFNQDVSRPFYVPVTRVNLVQGTGCAVLPANVGGAVFAVLTTAAAGFTEEQLSAAGILAGPAVIIVS